MSRSDVLVFEIPSIIAHEHSANALGDFCAKKNFMRESYAVLLGLMINEEDRIVVTIGSGMELFTTGTVTTPFRFKDEPEVYSLTFYLLPNCIHDIILGKHFLKTTNTFSFLTNRTGRVIRKLIQGISHNDVLYLGSTAPRFTGILSGRVEEALADTGSRVLIMDEDYARLAGIPILTGADHTTVLRFADGSTALTSGMTYGIKWDFGLDTGGAEHTLDFHILKNAPAAVILSDEFLFETNAFAEFEFCLIDEDDDEDGNAHFFVIDRDLTYQNQGQSPFTTSWNVKLTDISDRKRCE
jgi:hypothetical protein